MTSQEHLHARNTKTYKENKKKKHKDQQTKKMKQNTKNFVDTI